MSVISILKGIIDIQIFFNAVIIEETRRSIMKYERKGGIVDELDGFGGVCILGLLQYPSLL